MTDFQYVGNELDLFANATNWKRYWASRVRGFLKGDVLEVGAGLGTNTELLLSDRTASWTCLEPDPALAERMRARFRDTPALRDCEVSVGTTQLLDADRRFDSILYIDVLEHIEADRDELVSAARLLRNGGRLIILAPAHQWLYSPFDKALGHFRRYDAATLAACVPAGFTADRVCYLDAVGLFASLGNRLLLRQADPTLQQILFWDRVLVPLSRLVDSATFHAAGKSVLGVWKKA